MIWGVLRCSACISQNASLFQQFKIGFRHQFKRVSFNDCPLLVRAGTGI